MEIKRKPFQGVFNIIRFNWHFYVIAFAVIFLSFLINPFLPSGLQLLIKIGAGIATFSILISLLISFYIYDRSDLYQLKWIQKANQQTLLNINAGFDETSEMIKNKFPGTELSVCDFYNPETHTEVSIRRARKAYPPYPGTITVKTDYLPFQNNQFNTIAGILSVHEIRNEKERVVFFRELHRILKQDGEILITEHLRNTNNFLAYTIGFFHFHSEKTWISTFQKSGFKIKEKFRSTPFITTFILEKNGNSL
ncbi:methyltransferase [Elizabethkingia meningoseptica]|uniref:Methyltransferase n=1 Tax=Elizabethkingia meningoseptica TaxID=238 RepID=A0A1V3TXP5_ELIME|nr:MULTISPECIES: class I SAM-dependent methyltransferase [Elizabethkingia]AQX13012.1 methyltransferase [Elizabethkingia meningoseptica]MBG0514545.1 class I SAM-dependent methyltransferase [Elizabethkingia meningoseptica]MDE5433460.1 class I SAM-dependent methyltransferase [Elizabethkingia meningoseptica]MDE5451161.1 class I SAM-dependent methyltransferase [Elizabethkingia meningoseptica]MDE5471171.1 class I SAM-dependent methyltransferase [Elizabethkingia meningoseptica]